MIEAKCDCLNIIHQIPAIINSRRRVQNDMIRSHLAALGKAIITENISPQTRCELADELPALFKQLS